MVAFCTAPGDRRQRCDDAADALAGAIRMDAAYVR